MSPCTNFMKIPVSMRLGVCHWMLFLAVKYIYALSDHKAHKIFTHKYFVSVSIFVFVFIWTNTCRILCVHIVFVHVPSGFSRIWSWANGILDHGIKNLTISGYVTSPVRVTAAFSPKTMIGQIHLPSPYINLGRCHCWKSETHNHYICVRLYGVCTRF